MNSISFTAVDFETVCHRPIGAAKGRFYIVQIGIAVVHDDGFIETYEHLVKPPVSDFDEGSMRVHHIHPADVAYEPTFEELWPQIEHFFLNTRLVAHNKSTEEKILHQYLDEMGSMKMGINPFDCTYLYYKKKSLRSLCEGFHVQFEEKLHHGALYDAICCAKIAQHMYRGEQPDWDIVEKFSPSRSVNVKSRHTSLKGDILVKNLNDADPKNPFYDRKVVITGIFSEDRDSLAHKIWLMGADINKNISKKTNFVIMGGEPGPKKVEAVNKLLYNGYNIKVLDEFDLRQIFDGVWNPYIGDKIITKKLDFTYEHFSHHRVTFDKGFNIIASKELYIGEGLKGSRVYFDIILGNLGAFDTIDLGADTQICVLSQNTVDKLEKGIKDDTIIKLEDFYNNNRSTVFDFTFLTEDDIIDFCKKRCIQCGDDLTLGYLNKYLNSII